MIVEGLDNKSRVVQIIAAMRIPRLWIELVELSTNNRSTGPLHLLPFHYKLGINLGLRLGLGLALGLNLGLGLGLNHRKVKA